MAYSVRGNDPSVLYGERLLVRRFLRSKFSPAMLSLAILSSGCGDTLGLFNPGFVNTFSGGVVPLTPGPGAAFVMVRCVNETTLPVEFIVTIERSVPVRDDDGIIQFDESGDVLTSPERETVRLITSGAGQAREQGTLFACGQTPVTMVGLGENLLPTDAAVFVGGQGTGGAAGFGVPAGNLNPLLLQIGNFNCGDTVIFRAFSTTLVAGGVGLQTLLLPGSEQPSVFQGPSTFQNFASFLDSQQREENP